MALNKQEIDNINDLFKQIDKLTVQVEALKDLNCNNCRCDEVLTEVGGLKSLVEDLACKCGVKKSGAK
jgi:hypothetical protein